MRQQRGTTDLTLYSYSFSIRDLLKRFGEDPSKFDAQSLRHFVLEKSQKSGWAVAKQCTTVLRMFLRFLIAEGKCAAGLDAAIPVLGTVHCVGRLTARCSLCRHVRDCVCPKQSGYASMTSPRMGR